MGLLMGDGKAKDTPAARREDRLKAALKANIARRKAQARARSDTPAETSDKTPRRGGPEQDQE